MSHGIRLSTALLAALLFISACSAISRQARNQVTFAGSFTQLQQDIAAHRGETVLLGGSVIETRPRGDETEIEVLQQELGSGQRPVRDDLSRGRFLVVVPYPHDPLRFPKGTSLAVVGEVLGEVVRPIGQMSYSYPLLQSIEFKTWPPDEARPYRSPRFQFGVGIGTRF